MSRTVYFNGRFVPEGDARVSIYDAGFLTGEMAYEVTRTIRHAPYRLSEHLARLTGSLASLRIDLGISLAELEAATLETLARNLPTEAADVDWQIIHNLSRGPGGGYDAAFTLADRRPTVLISCFPLVPRLARLAPYYDSGVPAIVPPQRAIPHDLLPVHIKARGRLHYQLASLAADELRPGAWPVLVDPGDCVTEGTSYNVFAVRRGVLRTSPADAVLIGVTRGVVLDLAGTLGIPVDESPLPLSEALSANELFVTSTSMGILHVCSLCDARRGKVGAEQLVGDGHIGPVTARLREALHTAWGLDCAAQARSYVGRTLAG